MAFTHVRGNGSGNTSSSGTVTMGGNPATGNIVCVGIGIPIAATGLAIVDGNSNAYTLSPNSPSGNDGTSRVWLFYLLSAPSNANNVLTITWTGGSVTWSAQAEQFSPGVSGQAFDTDITATGSGNTINSPTITPTKANSLLWATGINTSGSIFGPIQNQSQGVWTGAAAGIGNSIVCSEYDLSASSGSAVSMTGGSASWAAAAMSFSPGDPFADIITLAGRLNLKIQ